MGTTAAPIHGDTSTLVVVSYAEDGRRVTKETVSEFRLEEVELDLDRNTWYHHRGDPKREQSFTIGSGLRVSDANRGPIMVIDRKNRKHALAYKRMVRDLEAGTLTR